MSEVSRQYGKFTIIQDCYCQCLRLNQTGLVYTSSGQIVNLMSNDVNKIDLVRNFTLHKIIKMLYFDMLLRQFDYYQIVLVQKVFGNKVCLLN